MPTMPSKLDAVRNALPFVIGAAIVVLGALSGWFSTQTAIPWAASAVAVLKVIVEVLKYVQASRAYRAAARDHGTSAT